MRQIKVFAVVPARGGSKGVKNKNLIDIFGLPLLSYTISSIKQSKIITDFVISSDSDAIVNTGLKYGACDIGLRPSDLSQDHSKTFDALKYSLKIFEEKFHNCDYILELQPTYPFRSKDLIDNALSTLFLKNWDSFTTVRPIVDTGHPDYVGKLSSNGSIVFNKSPNFFRRQELKPHYACIGSVMGAKVSHLKSGGDNLLVGVCGPVILENQFEFFDINDVDDVTIANKIAENNLIDTKIYSDFLNDYSSKFKIR